jgi:hypothetical protein
MNKPKKTVFLHDNRRKKKGGYTDMNAEEKLEYLRIKRESYAVRDKLKTTTLKDSKSVYLNNWQLVMGLSI